MEETEEVQDRSIARKSKFMTTYERVQAMVRHLDKRIVDLLQRREKAQALLRFMEDDPTAAQVYERFDEVL